MHPIHLFLTSIFVVPALALPYQVTDVHSSHIVARQATAALAVEFERRADGTPPTSPKGKDPKPLLISNLANPGKVLDSQSIGHIA